MAVKRLLSIDGGGIRGIIAAEVLVKMEKELKLHNPKWQRLSDYFDFISGTSTGSIIAAGLATGMSAHELLKLYTDESKRKKEDKIFKQKKYSDQDLDDLIKSLGISDYWQVGTISNLIKFAGIKDILCQMLLTKYSGENLEKKLKEVLGEKVTLVSPNLKTNLMIVTNNVTRGQNWFFVNNTVKGEYKKESQYLKLNRNC